MNKKLKLEELNRVDVSTYKASTKIPVVVVVDNVRSLHNVGAFFRTADAFKMEKILLCGITARPPHREIHKTAIGATESVEWKYYQTTEEALIELKKNGYEVVAIEQTQESVLISNFKIDETKKYTIVFGNEVNGVSELAIEQADVCIEIPQDGTKHSLNVSVCAGIVMWEFYQAFK